MPGQNRFDKAFSSLLGQGTTVLPVPSKPCIFISHKSQDSQMAKSVADNLVEMNIDVWLDLDELDAAKPDTDAQHYELTVAIETGLQNSTHLLALITPIAQESWWVPFEIGSCRAQGRGLAFLLHKEVVNPPSYTVVGARLYDQAALYAWAVKLSVRPGVVSLRGEDQLKKESGLDIYVPKRRSS